MLREQNRMVAGIFYLPSALFYNRKLRDNPNTTALEGRPKAASFNAYIARDFGRPESDVPRIFVNFPGTVCGKYSSSRLNFRTISVPPILAESMIERGAAPNDVAIITFYKTQYRVYMRALRSMQASRPQLDLCHMKVRKVNSYHGSEGECVVFDLVVT
jgi:hypothetical protein